MLVSAQGLTKDDLMGDHARMLALLTYQLAFQYSEPEEERRLALLECLSGTTLCDIRFATTIRDTTVGYQ